MNALAAASTQRIAPSSYNGSDAGWTNVCGEEKSVRLHGTIGAFDLLRDEIYRMQCATLDIQLKRINAIINRYAEELAKRRIHSDDVIKYMVDTQPHLFASDAPAAMVPSSSASETSSGYVDTPEKAFQEGTPPRGGPQKGLCSSWVLNGNCRREDCPLAHPARVRGGRGAGGGRRPNGGGGGGGGPRWGYDSPGWGWHNSNNGNWGKGGRGRGKGKGGRTAGKGGGRGGWWN